MKAFPFIICLFSFLLSSAQNKRMEKSDSALSKKVFLLGVHLSGHIPDQDLAKRYGPFLKVSMPLLYKTKSNYLFGVEGAYLFSSELREDVLKPLRTTEGTLTNTEGNPATVRINLRGWQAMTQLGKIWPLGRKNPNSGFTTLLGIGYIWHKMNLYDVGKNFVPLNGDRKKGYDRLTGGLCITEHIGYFFMSDNKITNFYLGLECMQAFTRGLRGFQYDTMQSDNAQRLDFSYGIRLGWNLPLYGKNPENVYYY